MVGIQFKTTSSTECLDNSTDKQLYINYTITQLNK